MTDPAEPRYEPGSIFLAHSDSFLGALIRTGEWLREHVWQVLHHSRRRAGAWEWNHAGVIVSAEGGTIEALGAGVVRSDMHVHDDAVVCLPPVGVDPTKVVAFAERQLGRPYGWIEVVLMGVDCVLGTGFRLRASHRSWICSELAAAALEAGGFALSRPVDLTMPFDLAEEVGPWTSP